MAQRVGTGIVLLFHDRGIRRGEWSAARLGRTLPPGKIQYPFYWRLDGPQGRSWRAENLVRTWIPSRTLQPVISRYTDWATGPTPKKFSICPYSSWQSEFSVSVQPLASVKDQNYSSEFKPVWPCQEYTEIKAAWMFVTVFTRACYLFLREWNNSSSL